MIISVSRQQPVTPTPREKMFKEAQILRNGRYINAFGEEKDFEYCYNWAAQMGWAWSVAFPLVAIRDMADTDEEFERILKIVFSIAGKSAFIEPTAVKGIREQLGVPNDVESNDGRIMGGYIKSILDTQLVPNEMVRFDEEETRIEVDTATFEGRNPFLPTPEITLGYEALWHNMVKTMVSPEWSLLD